MSYEKDQFGGVGGGEGSASVAAMISTALAPYVTSASLTTALGTYVTSASLATAIAPYVTSASLNTALAIAPGQYLLGSANLSTQTALRFSGSWSDYAQLDLLVSYRINGTSNTASIAIYTDGGTTPFLNINNGTASTGTSYQMRALVQAGSAYKSLRTERANAATVLFGYTATANAGFINCIQLTHGGTSNTLASGVAQLFGIRR